MEEAGFDLCGDETIRVTESCGEALSGVTDRVKNKPGVTKGYQRRPNCSSYQYILHHDTFIHAHIQATQEDTCLKDDEYH